MRFLLSVLLSLLVSSSSLHAQPTLSTKNKKAIELYTQADNYRVRGQYREALSLLDQALEKDKNFSEAYFRQAIIYKSQRNYPRSTELYLKGLSITQDQKKQKAYFYELGENYLLEGDYEKSQQFLDRYLDAEILNKPRIDQATGLYSRWRSSRLCEQGPIASLARALVDGDRSRGERVPEGRPKIVQRFIAASVWRKRTQT